MFKAYLSRSKVLISPFLFKLLTKARNPSVVVKSEQRRLISDCLNIFGGGKFSRIISIARDSIVCPIITRRFFTKRGFDRLGVITYSLILANCETGISCIPLCHFFTIDIGTTHIFDICLYSLRFVSKSYFLVDSATSFHLYGKFLAIFAHSTVFLSA